MKPVITNLDDVLTTSDTLAVRIAPKKLSLRVSGSRIGSLTRPATDGVIAAATLPAARLGLRAHTSMLARPAGSPAATVPFGPNDYATADDYE
jgi:hypothetical protein